MLSVKLLRKVMKYLILFSLMFSIIGCASTELREAPNVVQKATPFACKKPPQFPIAAIRKKIEGWVILEYSLDNEGYPHDMVVLDSSPEGYFEKSAIESMSSCRFKAPADVVPNERLKITLDFKYS
jgi:TonB family protein